MFNRETFAPRIFHEVYGIKPGWCGIYHFPQAHCLGNPRHPKVAELVQKKEPTIQLSLRLADLMVKKINLALSLHSECQQHALCAGFLQFNELVCHLSSNVHKDSFVLKLTSIGTGSLSAPAVNSTDNDYNPQKSLQSDPDRPWSILTFWDLHLTSTLRVLVKRKQ